MSGKCAGMAHKEKRSTAENEAKCQIEAYNRFGNDVLIAEYGLHTVGKSLGSKMSDPEDAVPAIIDHVLKDLADIDQLDFERVKLKNSKDFQLHLECAKILIERMGKEVPTGTLISGPLTAVASIYPVEKLLKALRKKGEDVHKLMRLCTDALKEVHNEFVNVGSMILFCEPIASGSIISPKDYREFVLPYTIELMKNIHDHKGMVCYHICGDTKKIIPEMLKTKPDMISIDNRVPIEFAKELIQPYMPLVGNVDPVETMILGTPENVDKAIKHCIKEAYDSKNGYILCTGCDLNGNIPLENLDAFMNAARKYGKFPISPSNWE